MNNTIKQQTDDPITYYPPYQHQSDMPWLRLFILSTGDPKQIHYLEKALQANPYNKQTLRLMERLDPQRARQIRTMINCLIELYGPP